MQQLNAALLGGIAGLSGGMYVLEEHLWYEEDGDTPAVTLDGQDVHSEDEENVEEVAA